MPSYTDFAIECSRGDALTLNIAVTAAGVAKDLSTWTGFKLLAKASKTNAEEDARFRLTDSVGEGLTVTDDAGGLLTAAVPAAATRALEDKKGGRILYTELYGTDADGWTWLISSGTITAFPLTWTKTPAWSPKSLSSLTLWLRADQATYSDATFTTAAATDGAAVGGWKDKSGKTHHYTQSIAAWQPTKVLSAINGLPVIRSSGSGEQWMGGPLISHLCAKDQFHWFGVVATRNAGVANGSTAGDWPPIWGDTNYLGVTTSVPGGEALTGKLGGWNSGGTVDEVELAYTFGTAALLEVRHRDPGGGSVLGIRLNGGSETTAVSPDSEWSAAYTPETVLFGDGSQQYAACDIAEILLFNAALADADAAKARDYLTARYALSTLAAAVTKA